MTEPARSQSICLLFLSVLYIANSSGCILDKPNFAKQNVKVKIIDNDWVSHKVIAHIAKIILEEQLKIDVQLITRGDIVTEWQSLETGELKDMCDMLVGSAACAGTRAEISQALEASQAHNSFTADYQFLARDLFDANLEIWRSEGKRAAFDDWVQNPVHSTFAHHVGDQDLLAWQTSVYVPKYLVDANPEAEFFNYLLKGDTESKRRKKQEEFSQIPLQPGEALNISSVYCSILPPGGICTDTVWYPAHCGQTVTEAEGNCPAQIWLDQYYSYGKLEQRIANNKIPASVLYFDFDGATVKYRQLYVAGETSSTTVREKAWDAYSQRLPFAFLYWYPAESVHGLSKDLFTRLRFPPPGGRRCPALSPGQQAPASGTPCDENQVPLQKVVSPRLMEEKYRDAKQFIESFHLNQDDYDFIFEAFEYNTDFLPRNDPVADNKNAYEVACNWIRRKGRSHWGNWTNYTLEVEMTYFSWDSHWKVFWAQFIILIVLWILPICIQAFRFAETKGYMPSSDDHHELLAPIFKRNASSNALGGEVSKEKSLRSLRGPLVDPTKKLKRAATGWNKTKAGATAIFAAETTVSAWKRVINWQRIEEASTSFFKFKRIVHSKRLGFMTSIRSKENFVNPDGIYIARDCGQTYFRMKTETNTKLQLVLYLVTSKMGEVIPRMIQYALLAGLWGTFIHAYEENWALNSLTGLPRYQDASPIMKLKTAFSTLVSNFLSVPTFFVIFKANSHINRWLSWVGNAGSISGRLLDLALIVGSLEDVNHTDPKRRDEVRTLQFQFYRYLNLVHILAFFGLDDRVAENPEDLVEELGDIGLLEEEEKYPLLKTASAGMHATALSWLAILWHKEIEFHQGEGDNHPNCTNFMEKLMGLRGSIGCCRVELDYADPEITRAVNYLVVYLMLFFVLIGVPIQFYQANSAFPALQWQAMIICMTYMLMFGCLLLMGDMLQHCPFNTGGECVNTDYLLCGTEEMMFYKIRAGYAPCENRHYGRSESRGNCIYSNPVPREEAGEKQDDAGVIQNGVAEQPYETEEVIQNGGDVQQSDIEDFLQKPRTRSLTFANDVSIPEGGDQSATNGETLPDQLEPAPEISPAVRSCMAEPSKPGPLGQLPPLPQRSVRFAADLPPDDPKPMPPTTPQVPEIWPEGSPSELKQERSEAATPLPNTINANTLE